MLATARLPRGLSAPIGLTVLSFFVSAAAGQSLTVLNAQASQPGEPRVTAMSADGHSVGYEICCGVHSQPTGYIWREGSGSSIYAQPITTWDSYRCSGLSADGSVLAATYTSGVTGTTYGSIIPSTSLGTFPGGDPNHCTVTGMSGDGTIVIADCLSSTYLSFACRWTAATGMVNLGTLPDATESHATGISADGQVIVGYTVSPTGTHAFRWTAATGMVNIGSPLGLDAPGAKALSVNADGSVIFGSFANSSGFGSTAVRWSPDNDAPISLGTTETPEWTINLVAVSADGSTAVGYTRRDGTVSSADGGVIWKSGQGLMRVSTFMAPYNFQGVGFLAAGGISADGLRLAGAGVDGVGRPAIWIVTLPPPPPQCGSADFNCDGDVGTDSDIESFFSCLSGACPTAPCTNSADFNHDGDVGTDADIEAFFRVLGGGTC